MRDHLRCRFCWRATIFVFLSILAIEAAIFVPSYLRQEKVLLDRLEASGMTALSASLHAQLDGGNGIPVFSFSDWTVVQPLVGFRLYSQAGNVLGTFGDAPDAGLSDFQTGQAAPRFRAPGERYVAMWDESDLRAPVIAVASLDSRGVTKELAAYVLRILGLTVLVSLFVSAATMGVLSLTVLRPVLLLHRRMLQARENPESAGDYTLDFRGSHELGEMVEAFNTLMRQLSTRYRTNLDASEQRFQDFARSASDWYWEMDERLRFSYFSERFQDVTGVPPEQLLGKTRQETGIPEVSPEEWRTHLDNLAARRPFRNFVHPRRMPDGQQVWLSINGQPYYDVDGHFRGYRGTGSDITRLKRTEADLRVERDRAEVANRAKSEFLANMSHEIRTPMTAVIGMAELLRGGPLTEDQRSKVDTIIQSGEGLLVIINDILDLSRLEAGKLQIEQSDIDLNALLVTVVELMDARAAGKGLALTLALDEDVPRFVAGDSTRIRQILINLIGNAIKFTRDGHVTVGVCKAPQSVDSTRILFWVEDSGIGIEPDDLSRLFDKFEQAESTTNRLYGGSGLGLAISKQLVGLMDGEIGAESIAGLGSRFWFTLPLHPIDRPASDDGKGPVRSDEPATSPSHAKRPLKILLAEDNEVNQVLIRLHLEPFGHDLTTAGDGELAVVAAEEARFDAILMDIRMPTVDGIEATRRIRAGDGPNRDTPIVAVTADAMVGNEQGYLDAGMNAIATKPIRLVQLLRAIDQALGETIHLAADESGESGQPTSGAGDSALDVGAKALLEQLEVLDRRFG